MLLAAVVNRIANARQKWLKGSGGSYSLGSLEN